MNEKGKRFTLFFLEEKESSEMEPEAIEKERERERENVIKERRIEREWMLLLQIVVAF
jgi:hypothetical protein